MSPYSILKRCAFVSAFLALTITPAHATPSRKTPAEIFGSSVKGFSQGIQLGFVKNAKSFMRKIKSSSRNKPSRTSRSGASSDAYSSTTGPVTQNIVFGYNCPNGGRFFFSGSATADPTAGTVVYNGVTIFNRCGSAAIYGATYTTASIIASTSAYSIDTQGVLSGTTSLCTGATSFGYQLSLDGVSRTKTIEGATVRYCDSYPVASCTFPAGTPVNSSLSSFCTQSAN